jgi:hypothetical protein
MRLLCVLAVLAASLQTFDSLAQDRDKGKVKLSWKLPKGRVAEFRLLDKAGKPLKDSVFWVFPHELREDGSNRIVVDRYADLAWPLLFTLPKDEKKPGDAWEHTAFFFHEPAEAVGGWGWGLGGPSTVKPLCLKGAYVFKKLEKHDDGDLAQIEGAFTLYEIRRDTANNQVRLTITKNDFGTLRVGLTVSVPRGQLVRGRYTLQTRAQDRVVEKGDSRVVDTKIDAGGGVEFAEEVELAAEKMQKAVEAQVKKAVEWLRKQQRPAGDFGVGPTIETTRVDADATGLCVRALLAAGAKPDDPAVEKAVKRMRADPGKSTQALGNALCALVFRHADESRDAVKGALAKEDTAAVRAIANLLLNRRDPKLSLWASTDDTRNATLNVISSMHALEGLWAAALAGVDVPADAWKNIIDTVTLNPSETDDADVELKLEFAEGAGLPDPDGPKKAKPLTWRYDIARKGQAQNPNPMGGSRSETKGWSHTVLAALEDLKLAQMELERAKKLSDGQKKSLDGAMRNGLAWVQDRLTFRTPPPAEAYWSLRKIEYLHMLGRVLSLYGVTKVDGSDWCLEGAYHLLRLQHGDGRWDEGNANAVAETAHAILFLTRIWPAVR